MLTVIKRNTSSKPLASELQQKQQSPSFAEKVPKNSGHSMCWWSRERDGSEKSPGLCAPDLPLTTLLCSLVQGAFGILIREGFSHLLSAVPVSQRLSKPSQLHQPFPTQAATANSLNLLPLSPSINFQPQRQSWGSQGTQSHRAFKSSWFRENMRIVSVVVCWSFICFIATCLSRLSKQQRGRWRNAKTND